MPLPTFNETTVLQIARALQDALTHRDLSAILSECRISEQGGNPKWERINLALTEKQRVDGCGNNVGAFIQAVLNPVRFVNEPVRFEDLRNQLNQILAFSGLQLGIQGKLHAVVAAATIDEAKERAGRLRKLLEQRRVHADVLAFCREELVRDNYFHAVFEATKSVADKIRRMSGLPSDGSELVDGAFSLKNPLLAINSLQTETEQSEHKGFCNLLRGVLEHFETSRRTLQKSIGKSRNRMHSTF